MRVAGATVLITGASSGIGAATARAVVGAQARAVLLARSAGRLDALAEELGPRAHAYVVDCSDREALASVARRITDEIGTPDVIVNNAGAGRWLFFDETEPAEFERMMSAPFFAAVFTTRAFLPAMIERGSGLILNVNAPIAFVPWQSAAGYGMARWATRGLSELLRADLADTGVTVSQVVPGPVSSEYFANNRHRSGDAEDRACLRHADPGARRECDRPDDRARAPPRHHAYDAATDRRTRPRDLRGRGGSLARPEGSARKG